MTQNEINQIYERVAWLERKMVRIMRTLISADSLFVGWVIPTAIFGDSYGWERAVVFVTTWVVLGFILGRIEFKGAPKHIEYIDP